MEELMRIQLNSDQLDAVAKSAQFKQKARMVAEAQARALFLIDGNAKERKPQPRNRAERRRAASLDRC